MAKRLLSGLLLFLAINIAGSSEGWATSCGRIYPFTVGMCSKTSCSETFSVDYEWWGPECQRRKVVQDTNPEMLAAMLESTQLLGGKEQKVLFYYQAECHSVESCKEYQLTTIPLEGYGPWPLMYYRIARVINLEEGGLKEIKEAFELKARQEAAGFVLWLYLIPLFILPCISFLIALFQRKVLVSNRRLYIKLLVMLVTSAIHLVAILWALIMGSHGPYLVFILFTLALYPWLIITVIRKRRKKSHDPAC